MAYHSADSVATWITLEYFNHHAHTDGYDSTLTAAGLTPVKANEYWSIASAEPVKGQVEITYTALSATTGVATEDIRVISWNGSQWANEGPASRTATATNVISDNLAVYSFFTTGVDSSCVAPAAPAFANAGVCEGNELSLHATGDGVVRWYINAADNTPFATGDSVFIGFVNADTVFYAEVKHLGCISNRVAYPVVFNIPPAVPAVTSPVNICYQENAELVATVTGAAKWFSDINAQNLMFTE